MHKVQKKLRYNQILQTEHIWPHNHPRPPPYWYEADRELWQLHAVLHPPLSEAQHDSLGWMNLNVPFSRMTSVKDRWQTAGERRALRTEEVSTQEALTHTASVRLRGLSASWRLGSVITNHTSRWPTSLWGTKEHTQKIFTNHMTQKNKSKCSRNWTKMWLGVKRIALRSLIDFKSALLHRF